MNEIKKMIDMEYNDITLNIPAESFKKHKKHHRFSVISGIAASLALIMGIGAVYSIGSPKASDNGFVITANAMATDDEAKPVSSKEFTPFSTILPDSEICRFNKDNKTYDCFTTGFGFDINCQGENINSITYTVKNGAFYIKENAVDKLAAFNEDLSYTKSITGKEMCLFSGYKSCSSYTVSYNSQPKIQEDEFGNPDPVAMLMLGYNFNNDEGDSKAIKEYIDMDLFHKVPDRGFDREQEIYSKYLNELVKDTEVEIKVTYNDNSTASKTLVFSGNINDQKPYSYNLSDGEYSGGTVLTAKFK